MASAADDRYLGSGPSGDGIQPAGDESESDSDSDSDSILSDDSVLPVYTPETKDRCAAGSTLYSACARNEVFSLRRVLERGVRKEEVMELDVNGWVSDHQ